MSIVKVCAVLALAAVSMLGALPAIAQSASANLALDHGSVGRYGGWNCDHGYKLIDARCVAVVVPANAYLTPSGDGWACERLYRKRDSACEAVLIPANAYADGTSYGTGWRCEQRYRASGAACVAIEVPANAFAVDSTYGNG